MDVIKQYQKISEVKPLFQKLTEPMYNVNAAKIALNKDDLELVYVGMGLFKNIESKKIGGSYDVPILVADVEDLDYVDA